MKIFLSVLLMVLSIELTSAPVTHSITYNSTSSVVCAVGDTLKFYATNAAMQGIQINSVTVIPPAYPASNNYIGYYVIIGGESSFTFYNDINFLIDHTGSIILADNNTGFYTTSTELNIKVFPNPVTHTITIYSAKEANMEFCTSEGKVILSGKINENENTINISSFLPGVYILRINSKSTKIIKY